MGDTSEEYEKGYSKGRKAARESKDKGVVEELSDHVLGTGRHGGQKGSTAYKEGFKQGMEDEKKKS